MDLVAPPCFCIEVEGKWISGASSCHEARHAQPWLTNCVHGMQIKLIEARASIARSKILASHVAIAQSRLTKGDVGEELLCCARDGIIAEDVMGYTS